jgi:chorismate mutase
MSDDATSLDALRREIDAIDEVLHDQVMRRAALMQAVARSKDIAAAGSGAVLRPGREATVLRRLIRRHAGNLPVAVVVRIWRELMSSAAALQTPLRVAVCAPTHSVAHFDLARSHFGSSTPMTLHRSASVVLRAISESPGTVGLLPLPQEGESDPWWPALMVEEQTGETPRVVWWLPFFEAPGGRFENLAALAVAVAQPEETEADCTLLAVETAQSLSRARLRDLLRAQGFGERILAGHEESGHRLTLLELDGFVRREDERLKAVLRGLGEELFRSSVLGAYPVPISPSATTGERET